MIHIASACVKGLIKKYLRSPKTQKIKQMLVRMWKEGNLPALLVGMSTGAAAMENSVEAPQNIKNGATIWAKEIQSTEIKSLS